MKIKEKLRMMLRAFSDLESPEGKETTEEQEVNEQVEVCEADIEAKRNEKIQIANEIINEWIKGSTFGYTSMPFVQPLDVNVGGKKTRKKFPHKKKNPRYIQLDLSNFGKEDEYKSKY